MFKWHFAHKSDAIEVYLEIFQDVKKIHEILWYGPTATDSIHGKTLELLTCNSPLTDIVYFCNGKIVKWKWAWDHNMLREREKLRLVCSVLLKAHSWREHIKIKWIIFMSAKVRGKHAVPFLLTPAVIYLEWLKSIQVMRINWQAHFI